MKIQRITIDTNGVIYGLGNDNKMYWWNAVAGEWTPFYEKK